MLEVFEVRATTKFYLVTTVSGVAKILKYSELTFLRTAFTYGRVARADAKFYFPR